MAGRGAHVELWRDVAGYLPSIVLPRLSGLITLPIVTRLFPPDTFGTYALVISAMTALNSAAMTGLFATVLRFLPEYDADERERESFLATIVTASFVTILAFTALVYGLLSVFSSRINPHLLELMPIGLLLFIANSMFALVSVVLRSRRQVGTFSAVQLLATYAGFAVGMFLVLVSRTGIGGLLWGSVIATAAATVFTWRLALGGRHAPIWTFSKQHARHFVSFATFVSAGNAAYWLLSLSDRWLLEFFRGTYEVGLYSVSYDLTGKTTQLVTSAFALALQPLTVALWEHNGKRATEDLISRSTRSYILLVLPATVGLSALAGPILLLIASDAYAPGAIVVPFVAVAAFLYGLLDLAARGLTLAKRADIEARNLLAAGMVNLGLNIVLIPIFGFVAAGATTLLGYLCLILLHTASARPYLTWRFPWGTLARASLACAAMGLSVFYLDLALAGLNLIARLLLLIATGVLLYASGLALTREMSISQMTLLFATSIRQVGLVRR